MTPQRSRLRQRLDAERIIPCRQINNFTLKNLMISARNLTTPGVLSIHVARLAKLSEDTMRIVIMGLLVGSALGVLAGTAVSAYVAPTMQVLQSYQNQANASETREWNI
jgi:hypothetical protein